MKAGSLVALHGFTGQPAMFAALGLLDSVERAFVPTLLGHGPKPEIPSPTFQSEVERLTDEIARLPAPRRLLGYSQGARLGLGVLTHAPQLFERAILIAAQPGLGTSEERQQRRQQEDGWIAQLEEHGVPTFIDTFGRMPLFGPARDPRELRRQQPFRYEHTAAGLISALLVLGTAMMPNLWAQLERVTCPVDLWTGALDEKYVGVAQAMARALPRAQAWSFAGAYHNPIIDCPAAVSARLTEWLAS